MGPAWPLRGNLAAFDEKLAQSFMQTSISTKLYTFSLQYHPKQTQNVEKVAKEKQFYT
jgi:hypothetical protein